METEPLPLEFPEDPGSVVEVVKVTHQQASTTKEIQVEQMENVLTLVLKCSQGSTTVRSSSGNRAVRFFKGAELAPRTFMKPSCHCLT